MIGRDLQGQKIETKYFHAGTGIVLKTKMSLPKFGYHHITEVPMYGCATSRCTSTTTLYCRFVDFQKKKGSDHVLAEHDVLARTKCESTETTILRRRLTWADKLLRINNSRLPKAMLFGELDDGKRRLGRPPTAWRQDPTKARLRDLDIYESTWTESAAMEKLW